MEQPKLKRRRALFVLGKIDEILAWEKTKEQERDVRFVDLGRYLCEVRTGQYWRLENLKSFEDYLEKRFPDSRRKAYYLMAIHENLSQVPKHALRRVGWTKAVELAKVARRDRQGFECATWLHKATSLPKQEFKGEVEKHLTGCESEPWDLLYFKMYKSQLAVVEQALETAGLMLGTNKSRGYCLEMICADFLAGANLDGPNPEALMLSLRSATDYCRSSSKTNSGTRSGIRHAESSTETTSESIGPRRLQGSLQRGSGQRQLALPELWHRSKPSGASHPSAKQAWTRQPRKPDHTVRRLS